MSIEVKSVAVFGATGGIGSAFVSYYQNDAKVEKVYAFSRKKKASLHPKTTTIDLDIFNEDKLKQNAEVIKKKQSLSLIIICTGFLHNENMRPEKSITQCHTQHLLESFKINSIAPLLIAKHFLPVLDNKQASVLASLSARVGSISDNRLGGWYGYRASKAALNMYLKTLSIECKVRYPHAQIIGLHPGTVDSELSKPYTSSTPKEKLFSAHDCVSKLAKVIREVSPSQSGSCLAWDGSTIAF